MVHIFNGLLLRLEKLLKLWDQANGPHRMDFGALYIKVKPAMEEENGRRCPF